MSRTLVSTVTVGAGGAASIEFTGIPQSATDLVILFNARYGTGTSGSRIVQMQVNNDTASNYTVRYLTGNGTGATSGTIANTYLGLIYAVGDTATASTFSNNEIYIPNYTSATAKTFSSNSVTENNVAAAYATIAAGSWTGTAAVTSVKLFDPTYLFVQYSTASLYTITKGSGGATVA
jgi:hypothetical protein